jgi:hypothetical protein
MEGIVNNAERSLCLIQTWLIAAAMELLPVASEEVARNNNRSNE